MTLPTEHRENRIVFRLWLCGVLLLAIVATAVLTAWAVRHATLGGPRLSESQAAWVLAFSEFPGKVRLVFEELASRQKGEPRLLLIDRSAVGHAASSMGLPAASDPGYLLFSGIDTSLKKSIVRLERIADGKTIAAWAPDWPYVFSRTSPRRHAKGLIDQNARAIHPLLLPDGDVVFNTGGSMVRMTVCRAEPVWVLDHGMHHSIDIDADGNLWAPSVSDEGFADNPWLQARVIDNSLAHVTPQGEVLQNLSFAKIMRDNGLSALLLGTQGLRLHEDPIHINQISVARSGSAYWERGDLLISARHSSTVFLYRPSTGKIVWHRTGPWLNQHAAAFVDDHRISVFNNNVFAGAPKEQPFIKPGDVNGVMIYDFGTDAVTEPYASLLSQARPMTVTEGRAQVLSDGGLFIEESNHARLLRFTKDKLLWTRVNTYDESRLGMVAWSRYLEPAEVAQSLRSIEEKLRDPSCTEGIPNGTRTN